jgi:hypothetical protein
MTNRWIACTKIAAGLVLGLVAVQGWAASDDATIAELKAQLAELSARLEAMESRTQIREETYQQPTLAAPAAREPGWPDRIRWKGDFRYRHESIDAEFASDDRHRNRVRARPALEARITDTVTVGMGLATGGDNPTSTNQTLGGAFSTKPIALDLAYFTWETPADGLSITAGKYKNPLVRAGGNGLIWDSDLRPEGVTATYDFGGFSLTGLMNWVTESSSSDNVAFGGQFDWTTPIGDAAKLQLGIGYYDLGSVEGREVPFDGDPRGNSVDAGNNYLYGYRELELFGEFNFNIGDLPAEVFFNYVENLDAPELDQGFALGGTLNFRHGNRPWRLGYVYQDLEADAVFAFFTDSDFAGGGTDAKGHIFRGSYSLTSSISFGGTLFINERGEANNVLGIAEDYNRLMLDVEFKY